MNNTVMIEEMEAEFNYLEWLVCKIDFDSAHEDVMLSLQEAYEKETGKEVPGRWKYE